MDRSSKLKAGRKKEGLRFRAQGLWKISSKLEAGSWKEEIGFKAQGAGSKEE